MQTIAVGSLAPSAGRTTVAAGIAVASAYSGRRTLALRVDGDAGAARDASLFRELPGSRGRGGQPLTAEKAMEYAASEGVDVLLLELPPAAAAPASADEILVLRGEADTLPTGGIDGRRVVATLAPQRQIELVRGRLERLGATVLGVLPEDQLLAAPAIPDLRDALQAAALLGDGDEPRAMEFIMVGPIMTDPAHPYYARRRRKAVLTRSDKTDLQLAALINPPDCLILTGGLPPSPYTLDRAASEETVVLLTQLRTRQAVEAIARLWATVPFRGEAKVERAAEIIRRTGIAEMALALPGGGLASAAGA